MTNGVGYTAGLLATPSWGPGHCWEEGRQVVDQATEQIKLLFPLQGARAALSTWAGGCSGHPGLASYPGSASLRGKEPSPPHWLQWELLGDDPAHPKCWFAKR